jgi:hypothetical protein
LHFFGLQNVGAVLREYQLSVAYVTLVASRGNEQPKNADHALADHRLVTRSDQIGTISQPPGPNGGSRRSDPPSTLQRLAILAAA